MFFECDIFYYFFSSLLCFTDSAAINVKVPQNTVGYSLMTVAFFRSFIVSPCFYFPVQVVYWDAYDGSAIRELEGSQSGAVNGMHISHDGRHFVTGKWPIATVCDTSQCWCAPVQRFIYQSDLENHSESVKGDIKQFFITGRY